MSEFFNIRMHVMLGVSIGVVVFAGHHTQGRNGGIAKEKKVALPKKEIPKS